MKTLIQTKNTTQAIGPYSQAVRTEKLLFVSGQLGLDINGNLVSEDISSQTTQALENIRQIITSAGLEMNNIVKATIYLTDLNNFTIVNDIYRNSFTAPFPTRTCIQVAGLPKGAKIEIEVIATFK